MNWRKKLRRLVQDNGWNAFLSLVFTISIMIMIDDELQATWSDVEVKITLIPPQGYQVVRELSPAQSRRVIDLRGPREDLSRFRRNIRAGPKALEVDRVLKETDFISGERAVITVSRENVIEDLPEGITIGPGAGFDWKIEVVIDRIVRVTRLLEIIPVGRPATGFRLGPAMATPQEVTIFGPESEVNSDKLAKITIEVPVEGYERTILRPNVRVNSFPNNLGDHPLVGCDDIFDVEIAVDSDDVWWTEVAEEARFIQLPVHFLVPFRHSTFFVPFSNLDQQGSVILDVRAPRRAIDELLTLRVDELEQRMLAFVAIDADVSFEPTLGPDNKRIVDDRFYSADKLGLLLPAEVSQVKIVKRADELGTATPVARRRDNTYQLSYGKFNYDVKQNR